jgi:opacity protein-like surface antigen
MAYWPAWEDGLPGEIERGENTPEEEDVKRKLSIFVIISLAVLMTTSAGAGRPDKSWKSWFGHFAGGYTSVIGDASNVVENGWNLNGGATYWPEAWPVGLDLELGYNDLGFTNQALQGLESVDSTTFTAWSMTTDVMWGPKPGGTVNVYMMGGVGVYRVNAQLGQTTWLPGWVCDPWYYWCYPGLVPGTEIFYDETQTKFGYNFGAGITFQVGLGSQIYVEAKWHRVETDPESLDYIPIVVGYRW